MKPIKLVYGIGLTDVACVDNKQLNKSYVVWTNMLCRCYSSKYQIKYPTYKDCSVHQDWQKYSVFKSWFDTNFKIGYQLDKDILVRTNKIYGPQFCRFVPRHINTILNSCISNRSVYGQGVTQKGNYFQVQCNIDGKKLMLGGYSNCIDAHLAYKKIKENHIKETAKKAYYCNEIDIDIYNALLHWKI
jgi:hypothetical protein